jgi:hypothetical protein
MTGYLTFMQAKAHETEIGERVERARLARPERAGHVPPRGLRTSMARVLLGLAMRLDHGLRPTAVRRSTSGSHA